MYTIIVRNVCEALPAGLALLRYNGVWEESRAGRVLVVPCPVTTVYSHPTERVLLSAARDANPFFHLMEALWMLAGRQDVAFLDTYIKDFGSRFGEDDGTEHDAYGHRWRHHFGFDQLESIVTKLRHDPSDRQAVLAMWDPFRDRAADLTGAWRTRPCNTHAYFRVRQQVEIVGASQVSGLGGAHQEPASYLDMTVCCRSNDMLWGAYGANAVHFSVLQEYLAAQIGVAVGTYYQVSNNFHIYEEALDRLDKRLAVADDIDRSPYPDRGPQALVSYPASSAFDSDLRHLLDGEFYGLREPFLRDTAHPMIRAHTAHRLGRRHLAAEHAANIAAEDWRVACLEWLARR